VIPTPAAALRRLRGAIAIALVLLLLATGARAQAELPAHDASLPRLALYYFWGDGCPVCAQQRGYLEWLIQQFPQVEVHAFEVWFVPEHRPLLEAFSAAYGQPVRGVPVTFIGEHSWVGFSQLAADQMTAVVDASLRLATPPDAGDRIDPALLARFLPEAP